MQFIYFVSKFCIKMPTVHGLAKDYFSCLSVTVNLRQAVEINRKSLLV